MKNLILTILFSLSSIFMFTSCETTAIVTTQDDIYYDDVKASQVIINPDFDLMVVIRNGVPYYHNGELLYYLYKNLYYYPFYYNNYWYMRAYRKPFRHLSHKPYFRPNRYDHKFRYGYVNGHNKPLRPMPNYRHRMTDRYTQYPNRHSRPNVGTPHTPRPHSQGPNVRNGNNRHGHRR